MPRIARQKSESGFYHVVLRGICRQNIFEDDEDNIRFLDTIQRFKNEMNFEIHAYCLMNNHVHLLIRDLENRLDLIIKKIGCSYVYYFNNKYDRMGHLFQDRFRSEAIEDDKYYLTALRYIHQNPEKAGIEKIDKYKWSSYNEYIKGSKLIQTSFALDLLGGTEEFEDYTKMANDDICLEISERRKITDNDVKSILIHEYGINSGVEISGLKIDKRNKILSELKGKGISVRQIARITGINRGTIQNA